MRRQRFRRGLRHPVLALAAATGFALAAILIVRGGLAAQARFAATAADPVKISDTALERSFDRATAEQEIRIALAADDSELAQSFVELAADRGISLDPMIVQAVSAARMKQASFTAAAGRFAQGLWSGEPVDAASLAGTALGDLFIFGDIRDAVREGARYLTGKSYDPWILGLAGLGIAVTAATYASGGVAVPERVGLSLVKAARRTDRLNPVLAVRLAREAVKVEEAGGLVEVVGNVGRIESKAGTAAALDGLKLAEGPEDVSRLARLAAAKGGKTRAIIKLLGRAAIVLTASALDLATWLLSAALMLFGFCACCKAAVERATLRYVGWRKVRRAREVVAAVVAVSS